MFFTNAIIYKFTKPFTIEVLHNLDNLLSELKFKPCGEIESSRSGWIPPIKGTEGLVHLSNKNALICLNTETRILPSSVVNYSLAEKVELIQNERGQKVGKKEKQTLKEEIIQQLLPKAFTKHERLYAYIDVENQRIVVNATSSSKAESLLAFLRRSISTLPILPHEFKGCMLSVMTHWVKYGVSPDRFKLSNNAQLKSLDEEASQANLKSCDLTEDEVQLHIANGKFVERLSLTYDDKISFDLTFASYLKSIKYSDIIKEQSEDINSDDALAKFDADFTIMSGELNNLINDLTL